MIGEIAEKLVSRISLAEVADFQIGDLRVRPARRQVCPAPGDCRDLEPRVMQVLVALARARGEVVSRDALIESCWEGRIVGDDSINRCVVALRHLARDVDPEPFTIETVARVGYCLVPAGDEAGDPADRGGSPAARRRLPRFGLALLAAAVLVLLAVGYLLASRDKSGAEPPRVRLGAIRSLSPDLPPGIGDSLREELIAALEVDDTLTVIAPAAGREPGEPPLALSATIQRAGDRLRFAVHLRNERSGASLWAQMFEVPRSIATLATRQVAAGASQVLRCGLPGAGSYLGRMTDRQLSLWLQFCQEVWSDAPTTRNRRIDAARRVTEAAPQFSRGWSSLALYVQPMGSIGPSGDAAAMRAEAARAVDEALRLDPQNSEAYASRAAAYVERRDWIEVERWLLRAIAVRPTDCTCEHHQYGFLLTVVGRIDEAVDQYRRFRDRQPLAMVSNASLAEALFRAGRAGEGESVLSETLQLWPGAEELLSLKLLRALWQRRYEEGANLLNGPLPVLPADTRSALAATFEALRSGRPAERRRAAEMLQTLARTPKDNSRLVTTALAAIGENRAAIESAESNGLWMRGVLFEPTFAGARNDPAFAGLVQRVGLVGYWRQTGRKPDVCRVPAAPGFCRGL